ncbi:hypothetical protein GCM10027563_16470 [Parasphingorhabdus pacifica]
MWRPDVRVTWRNGRVWGDAPWSGPVGSTGAGVRVRVPASGFTPFTPGVEGRKVRGPGALWEPISSPRCTRGILSGPRGTCERGQGKRFKQERATVTYVIAEPCVDVLDKGCIEECPVDCIYEGGRMLYIHPDECVDCGACEPVCPVEAIYYEDDVPEEWTAYTKANVDFFDDLGSPGGAAKVGRVNKDVEPVTSLPPQAE